jgi:membrane fusion protein, multidrug efflux system
MDVLNKDKRIEAGVAFRSRQNPTAPLPAPAGSDRPAPAGQARSLQRRKARILFRGVAFAVLAGAGFYGWHWWTSGRFLATTDDAYLQADKVIVAPRIAGYVAEVFASDNQLMKAGDVIARLDDREYQLALRQAEAEVEKATAALQGDAAAIVLQQAQIEQARADVENTAAALAFSSQEHDRYQSLQQDGWGTLQRRQQAEADLRQRRAGLDKAKAVFDGAQKQLDKLKAQEAGSKASLAAAKGKADQARLDLTYTSVTAPIAGVVGDRSLRSGQFVMAGTNLLTLVPMGRDIYLVANFKETQVHDMKAGQPVSFTVDALGGHEFKEGRKLRS